MQQTDPHPLLAALADKGILPEETLEEIGQAAQCRSLAPATLLVYEYGLPRSLLLETLTEIYGCAAIEYDERLPIPPDFLPKLSAETLLREGWFPVFLEQNNRVTIAAVDPSSPTLAASVTELLGCQTVACMITLPEDVQWFIQDYLHARPGELIGTERTGLAFWRNTMAQWRTLLACCRTDMAKARTALAFGRFGLSLVSIAMTLFHLEHPRWSVAFLTLFVGLLCNSFGLIIYLRIRASQLRPPGSQTVMEVTAATISFLEQYHFPDEIKTSVPPAKTGATMLARLGELLADYSTIIFPAPPSRERTHLARERNVLAAQRTVAACYRTIYARARTGLAFTRTGVSCFSFGVGLLVYFHFSLLSFFDLALTGAGLLMVVDGLLWYLPVRKEQTELPRSRSAALADQEDDL
ncbi:Type II secretion system protein GspE N-terminal domain-containing protein [Candidatus Electronema halotolerans]